jgi:hypothetical protein
MGARISDALSTKGGIDRGVAIPFRSAKHERHESFREEQTMRMLPILAILITSSAVAAESGTLIDGRDIDAIVDIARNYGSATIESQESGQPKIAARIGGVSYAVFFQNCSEPRACDDINLYAGFLDSNPSQDQVNTWNANKRFGRAYIDPDGDAALEMDINLRDGVSPANLSASFAIWRLLIIQFMDYLSVK